MENHLTPIISASELSEIFGSKRLVIVDARGGSEAHDTYLKEHLKGALSVDLDREMADIQPDVAHGGRHPLPSPEKFCILLDQLGITPESHVVVYDEVNCSNAAARFWWMLKSIGIPRVQVLNGGLVGAKKADFPMNSGIEPKTRTNSSWNPAWRLPLATMDEVEVARKEREMLIIDVRDTFRYEGIQEPIDLIAGHIPGAINIPYGENLDAEGNYLPKEVLREKYRGIMASRGMNQVIVHCGSGVTACHTILAMAYAEMEIPKLYVGSWSEWSRNNREIAVNIPL